MVTNADILRAIEGIDVATPVADIRADEPLVAQGLDSLDMATLMLALETEHKKSIPPDQATRLRTVADIVAFLNA